MPIYAAFDADGQCLYVGQTTRHPALRWAEHARHSPWAMDATRWEVVPDLTEAGATRRLRPVFSGIENAQTTILGESMPPLVMAPRSNRSAGEAIDAALDDVPVIDLEYLDSLKPGVEPDPAKIFK